jgi:hypothetical protein
MAAEGSPASMFPAFLDAVRLQPLTLELAHCLVDNAATRGRWGLPPMAHHHTPERMSGATFSPPGAT